MSAVRVRYRKWGDRPHWEYDASRVGDDEHGVWVGAAAGTEMSRPGASYVTECDLVSLVPHREPFVATFYADHPGGVTDPGVELYVDITTVPAWTTADDGAVALTMTDLDLDVVRGRTGRVWVDDEDEFADHRVRFGYPDHVIRLAATACDRVRSDVAAGRAPFGRELGLTWLGRLARGT